MKSVIGRLTRAALLAGGGDLGDAELLGRFLAGRDEAAFAALVRRHGPMVLGVCRRVLRNAADAEDAFQATFLVLVRKAASLRSRELLGGWLHGVAYRTALKAKTMAAKRRRKEAEAQPPAAPEDRGAWDDLLPQLDRELARLPEKYRVPVVLCELEGKSRREAARLLKLPEGTLSSRLATARKLLARRLTQSGAAVSGAALSGVLGTRATASVPRELFLTTVKAAARVVAGRTAAGVVSAQVLNLTEGVMRTMLLNRLKLVVVVALAFVVTGTGAGVLLSRAPAADPPAAGGKAEQPSAPKAAAAAGTIQVKNFAVEAVDVAAGTVTVADRNQPRWETSVLVKPNAPLYWDAVRVENSKPLHFDAVKIQKNSKTPLHWDVEKFVVFADNQAKLQNLAVAKDVSVTIDGRPGKLADLKAGMAVDLTLGADDGRLVIKSIQARKDGAKK